MRQTIGLSLALFVMPAATMAKQADSSHQPSEHIIKAKPNHAGASAARTAGKRNRAGRDHVVQTTAWRDSRARQPVIRVASADRYVAPTQVAGQREIGSAAWYGGRYLGRRTTSGDRLDSVRPTAAHRSLPLHSLARVTNLNNGRSVVVTITDRGPVSASLLIDVSPAAADQLEMKSAGVVPVSIEPVVAVAHAAVQQN